MTKTPKHPGRCRTFLILSTVAACAALAGCSFLKPVKPETRHFVLAPAASSATNSPVSSPIPIGVGPVKVPAYLSNTSLAIRKGANEIEFHPTAIWAERLDAGFQRVLAANLAVMVPCDQIRLSAWQREDVRMEVYVSVEQFDVDAGGRGVLVAHWRVVSPGGDNVLKSGTARLSRQSSAASDPSSVADTLSGLVADFSRGLADVLRGNLAEHTQPGPH